MILARSLRELIVLTFVIPAFWLARQRGFQIEHVWYLSVATVAIQAVIGLLPPCRELGQKLRFESPTEDGKANVVSEPHR